MQLRQIYNFIHIYINQSHIIHQAQSNYMLQYNSRSFPCLPILMTITFYLNKQYNIDFVD